MWFALHPQIQTQTKDFQDGLGSPLYDLHLGGIESTSRCLAARRCQGIQSGSSSPCPWFWCPSLLAARVTGSNQTRRSCRSFLGGEVNPVPCKCRALLAIVRNLFLVVSSQVCRSLQCRIMPRLLLKHALDCQTSSGYPRPRTSTRSLPLHTPSSNRNRRSK